MKAGLDELPEAPRAAPGAARLLAGLASRIPSGEVLRFGLVGVAATLTHLGMLRLGVERFAIPPVPANGLAFCLAVLVTYLGQSLWVFRQPDHSFVRLRRFLASVLAGLLANMAIMALTVGVFGLDYLVGFVSGLIIVPVSTFFLNKFWVFRKERG